MALRKAGAYSHRYARPFTRKSRVKSKSYIKVVPNTKVVKLRMGDVSGFDSGKYPIILNILAKEKVQMRDNAIESVRQYLHRFMTEEIGKDYYLSVDVYPHHILRENKMITGAGADRMQTGMALSFGASVGRAALIKAGQQIMTLAVLNTKNEQYARKLIGSCRAKLPGRIQIDTIYKKNQPQNS
jgi:large subunit ribosomal protein L10e